jgi:hypothetical protein
MTFSRADRRREEAKTRGRIDPACPRELRRDIDVKLASSIGGRSFFAGETLADVVKRECPDIFEIAAHQGFVLSFDLPENSHEALKRGVVAYSLKRQRLN